MRTEFVHGKLIGIHWFQITARKQVQYIINATHGALAKVRCSLSETLSFLQSMDRVVNA